MSNAAGTTKTIESGTVITAEGSLQGYYDPTGYYNGLTTNHRRISASASGSNPSNVVTISAFNNLEKNTKDTGQIVVSGDIANYVSPANATASISIVNRNGLNTDVFPVQEAGEVIFGPTNPTDAVSAGNENNFIQLVNEAGTVTTKWYAIASGGSISNGDALSGASGGGFDYPSGSRAYLIGGNLSTTASNFASAVNAYDVGFSGSAASPRSTSDLLSGNPTQSVTLTVAFTGSTPNRVGITSAALTTGAQVSSGQIKVNDFGVTTAGANELILGETTGSNDNTINYFTITDSASNVKNYFPSHDSTNQPTGSTGTRTFDDGSTKSVVYFNFSSSGNNAAAGLALVQAINGSSGHPSTITAQNNGSGNVGLTHDVVGTAGNGAALAKANIANSVATIF